MKKTFLITILSFASQIIIAQNITGQWTGTLNVQGTKLRLIFNIVETDNKLSSTIDSPDQAAKGIPCNQTIFTEGKLTISIESLMANYEGTLDGDTLKGTFSQSGIKFPLNLTKNTSNISNTKPNRPQEPRLPFPYRTEEVVFQNKVDGNTLAGTLTIPSPKGKYPVVLLISGSGAQNRDEEIFDHKPFAVIADYLTRNGIGVLRYDDRGTASSTGNFATATTLDLSRDAEAGVAYLLTRSDVDSRKIGLIGHSEGGIIAPMVAVRNHNVAFIIMLAGTGITGDQILLKQTDDIAKLLGTPENIRQSNLKVKEQLYRIVKNTDSNEKLRTDITALLEESLNNKYIASIQNLTNKQRNDLIQRTIDEITSPWIRYFIAYDPAPTLGKVKCPVLALNGELDSQVSAKVNLHAIRTALESGGNKQVTTIELPGLNHMFQECQTGAPSEYIQIEQTFSPKALEEIGKWIKKQTK